MNRRQLKAFFNVTGPAVFPVIHVLDEIQTGRNIRVALECGVAGVFLINHDFHVDEFLPIIRLVRREFPDLWLGINFLGVSGKIAFPVLSDLETAGYRIDGYWGDDARIAQLNALLQIGDTEMRDRQRFEMLCKLNQTVTVGIGF